MLKSRRQHARRVDKSLIKTATEIEIMREAGKIARHVCIMAKETVTPGMTTGQLEDLAEEYITQHGATSPCLGYTPAGHPPYPAWTCISVNEEIVHGIPGQKVIQSGDIVTMDCCVQLKGFVADTALTFAVGTVRQDVDRLLKVTEEALQIGISNALPGNTTGDVGWSIQKYAESNGYSVVRELHGHGVGRSMHESALDVPNYGRPGTGTLLETGMTFAIEPMVNMGRKDIRTLRDGWTIVTADGKISAHFEHTIAIGERNALILTRD